MLQMKSNKCMFMAYTVFRPVGCTSLGPNTVPTVLPFVITGSKHVKRSLTLQ